MAPKFLQIVFTQPSPDSDAEFNDWYENTHVPEVLRMPGFLSGQRFTLVDSNPPFAGPQYLAVYEIESDDIDATLTTITDMAPGRTKSPAIDTSVSVVRMYEAIGERQHAAE
ncbi:MAG TPA: hypothetical protein VGC45_00105 [Gryllotalpicola sp.]